LIRREPREHRITGFCAKIYEDHNFVMTSWDLGGRGTSPLYIRRFFTDVQALIFVVDSSDAGRLDETRDELIVLLEEDRLRHTSLLVFANKQDLPRAATPEEVTRRLRVAEKAPGLWHVQGVCGLTGEGLWEGLDWLAQALERSHAADAVR
jgi:ADP-ribosylation factor protein 1